MVVKKAILAILVFALELSVAAMAVAADPKSMLPDQVKSSGALRIGSQQTYPPIEFRDSATNAMKGVSVELLTEVASRLGLKLEWVQSDYGALITGAKAGRFDLASGGISDQLEREKDMDFVNYLITGTGILCKKDVAENFKTLADFSGKKVAFTLGAKKIEAAVDEASDELVKAGKKPIEKITLPNPSDAKMQLDLGRVDGYLNETVTLAYLMTQQPDTYRMVQDGNYILAPLVTSWGFVKGNDSLRDAVQAVLQGMVDDGAYGKILKAWDVDGGALEEITINKPWDLRK